MTVRIGGAPISWGVCEIPGWGPQLPYGRVLAELAAAGYEGTELGPWGFLPAEPAALRAEVARWNLAVAGAFIPLHLKVPARFDESERAVRETAGRLRELGARDILLADAGDEHRYRIAGRPDLTRDQGLTAVEWPGYIERLHRLCAACLQEYG